MARIPALLKQKLISIIKKDYEDCQFYEIGEVGLFISNSEKRLEEVEECYTKLVEALAEGKPNS
jgi:hypothetical protein